MLESRWVRWVGPGVVALGALGALASAAMGAGPAAWTPPACVAAGGGADAAAAAGAPAGFGDLRLEPWYRLDPVLDREGALQGQRLAVGTDGARSSAFVELPAESFAAGPFGRLILIGSDDGTMSRLSAIDVAGKCSFSLAEEAAVIRRATIDPAGDRIYEMLVDRTTRADLGIWSRPVDGSGAAVQVLNPIRPDDRFGRTFTTDLTWDLAGDRLAVQSCGEAACRVRLYDPSGGPTRTVDDTDLGMLVGIGGDQLVVYAACPGLPCPILGVDVRNGSRQVLAEAAAAAVIATGDQAKLVYEAVQDTGVTLRSVALDGSGSSDLGPLPDGLRLQAVPPVADAATRVPAGWVLVTPDGRLLPSGPSPQTQLRHVPDGAAVELEEVSR
ncbi:MAG: hypothetical protein ACXWXA_09760 [Candidatus Limnocylindrales bacterium]